MKSDTIKRPVPKPIMERAEVKTMIDLLLAAPARQTVNDERYWQWKARVDAFLARIL